MTHYLKQDYRITGLNQTIIGLKNSIKALEQNIKDIHWYDGDWFREESEPIFGLAFIAFQNYINSSIYDRFKILNKQYLKYKIGNKIYENGRTDIELIIGLANYFKHRDHPNELLSTTSNILKDFNLKYDKDIHLDESPIFNGLDILSDDWDLEQLVVVVEKWRENLWNSKND